MSTNHNRGNIILQFENNPYILGYEMKLLIVASWYVQLTVVIARL